MAKSTRLLSLTMAALFYLSAAARAQPGPTSEMPSPRPPVGQQPLRPAPPPAPPVFDPRQLGPLLNPPNFNYSPPPPPKETFGVPGWVQVVIGAILTLLGGAGAATLPKTKDHSCQAEYQLPLLSQRPISFLGKDGKSGMMFHDR
jgi:hypothetical protein